MAPNTASNEILIQGEGSFKKLIAPQADPRKYDIVWINVIVFTYYHLAGLYGLYLCFTEAMWKTILFGCLTYYFNALGITAGVHRLWAHRTYKAKLPLQIFLMLCHSLANQLTIVQWVRDHRLHHKHSDTNADPHNASRGFFYSHIGWILVKKHPEVKQRSKLIDMRDIYDNPVVMFQKRFDYWLIFLVAFILPTIIPVYFWKESFSAAYHVNMLRVRYILALNVTFLVNSVAHMWGYKPYDKHISPVENIPVSFVTLGEGYHNFHHSFPQDYRTGELGNVMNFTTGFVDFCAWLGLAYDRKAVGDDVIKQRADRTGDGRRI